MSSQAVAFSVYASSCLQVARVSGDKIRTAFSQNVALLRLNAAWDIAVTLDLRQFWLSLSGKAMETLNVAMALKVCFFSRCTAVVVLGC